MRRSRRFAPIPRKPAASQMQLEFDFHGPASDTLLAQLLTSARMRLNKARENPYANEKHDEISRHQPERNHGARRRGRIPDKID
jgi:hypothetical protein